MSNSYPWQWTWLQCSRTADGTTGDRPRTYTDNGTLWGSADLQTANFESEYGRQCEQVTGQAKFRNFPDISPLDRLTLQRDGMTFVIDGIRKDWPNNQLIVDIHQYTGT
jgi:hypothetical protein